MSCVGLKGLGPYTSLSVTLRSYSEMGMTSVSQISVMEAEMNGLEAGGFVLMVLSVSEHQVSLEGGSGGCISMSTT